MKKIKIISILFLISMIFMLPSFASTSLPSDMEEVGEWKILGITTVSSGLDRDEVKVTALKGTFTKVKIKVKQAPLEMRRCVVHFGNGETQEIRTRKNFTRNSETIPHTLHGGKRFIKKIVFWYNKKRWNGPKPVVVLLGSNEESNAIIPPIGGGGSGAWKVLGIKDVNGGLDRDEVKVTALKGMFSQVKIKVKRASLEMKKCIVHFGNGETQEIRTRKNFTKNSETIPHTFRGGKRFVKKVVFWYAKKRSHGPKPIVVLLGRE